MQKYSLKAAERVGVDMLKRVLSIYTSPWELNIEQVRSLFENIVAAPSGNGIFLRLPKIIFPTHKWGLLEL